MKVLNISEFIKLNFAEKQDYVTNISIFTHGKRIEYAKSSCFVEYDYVAIYNEFLPQEFKPEMLPKYFKKFVFLENHDEVYSEIENAFNNRKFVFSIFQNVEYCLHYIDEENTVKLECFHKLRTLHDFINDCERKEINLEWNV